MLYGVKGVSVVYVWGAINSPTLWRANDKHGYSVRRRASVFVGAKQFAVEALARCDGRLGRWGNESLRAREV